MGGDAFGFLMRQDKLAFPEAVRALAKTAGIALPEDHAPGRATSGREELLPGMDLAARFYTETLWAPGGARARDYLDRRGIDPELARRFGLGYAPEGWDPLLTFMRERAHRRRGLEKAGLVVARAERRRVLRPIPRAG